MEEFLRNSIKFLHSYAHGGMLQVGRRFNGRELKPNYGDSEIMELINVSTSATFMATNIVTKHFKFDREWEQGTELLVEWGKHAVLDLVGATSRDAR